MPDRDRDPRRDLSREYADYGDYGDYGDYEADEVQPLGVSRDPSRDRASSTPHWPLDRARRGRYYGVGPKGYRRSDERILEEVSDRLMTHPDVDASEIEVRVEHGVITLAGTVPDRHQKRIAEFIADDIVGVDDVHNELSVRHGFWSSLAGRHTDDDSAVADRERSTGRASDIAGRENAARAAAERDGHAR